VFALDKEEHEKLQKIVSNVETEQLNLNQALVNMGLEKKVYDKPLVEKMQTLHQKCDDHVKAIQDKI